MIHSAIPAETTEKALRHIQYVLKHVERFTRMSWSEYSGHLKRHPEDTFRDLLHPDGRRRLHCGIAAWERLRVLTDLVLGLDSELAAQVSKEQAFQEIRDSFTRCILTLEVLPTAESATQLLIEALRAMRASLVTLEHHFPCVMFVDQAPSQLTVGPVVFTRTRRFFQERKKAIHYGTALAIDGAAQQMCEASKKGLRPEGPDIEESKRHVRQLNAAAIKRYRAFPWVASVQVEASDSALSRERGHRTVELALHVIRILLGARGTWQIRIAWTGPDALRTAHLCLDSGGRLYSELSHSFAPSAPGWHESLAAHEPYARVLGSVLQSVANPAGKSHLRQRMIDAIAWFGDAATDRVPSSAIVKYVTAVERLLFGMFNPDRTKTFAKRISGVLHSFASDEGERTYQSALRIYRKRSVIVHGEIAQDSGELPHLTHEAEELSRMCLLCCTQLYPMMADAFPDVDAQRVESVMGRVCEEGVGWLASQAGWTLASTAS